MSDPFITAAHIREARTTYGGYCVNGLKVSCEHHGVSFTDLVRGRIRVSHLESLDDVLAKQLAGIARKRG